MEATKVIGKEALRELLTLKDPAEQQVDIYYSVDSLIIDGKEIEGDATYLLKLFSFITSKKF